MRLLWIAVSVVLLDQAAKVTVLRTMYRGQSIPLLGDWLRLTFTENPGMAFGITFGPPGLVTAFSLIATLLIIVYMMKVRTGYAPYRASLAFILGGAMGNIIDRVFYGKLFGTGQFFEGHVVDFIHVNIWRGYIPQSVPMLGGKYVALFPIWNVADMAIVVGVLGILLFQRAFHERLSARYEAADSPVNGVVSAADAESVSSSEPAVSSASPTPAWTPPTVEGEEGGARREEGS